MDFAKQRSDIEWILRSHPRFEYEAIVNKKATFSELYEYYQEWEKFGLVDIDSPWENVLWMADILITDCISFLYDATVLNCQVVHLRSIWQREPFSEEMMQIIGKYYQVYDVDQFNFAFELAHKSVSQRNRDLMPLPDQIYDRNASVNIYEFCNKTFGCR